MYLKQMYIKVHQSSSKYIIVCQIISKYIKKSKLSNIHNNDIVTFKAYSAKLVVKKNLSGRAFTKVKTTRRDLHRGRTVVISRGKSLIESLGTTFLPD